MRQCSAIAARVANSTTFLLSTGSAPGIPRQTGQTFEFGGAPKRVEHEQKILVTVSSWTWTSRPMTGSYVAWAAMESADVVTIGSDYKGQRRTVEKRARRIYGEEASFKAESACFARSLHSLRDPVGHLVWAFFLTLSMSSLLRVASRCFIANA